MVGNKVRRIGRGLLIGSCLLGVGIGQSSSGAQEVDEYARARRAMIQRDVVGRGIRNARVIAAMGTVPRHEFVPEASRKYAYDDAAIPIDYGQTITSPFVVAYMTEQLDPQPADRVLEIGTGSGYQGSILSQLVADVYTIEIVEPLGKRAAKTVARLGYRNVHFKIGDGYQGWPEFAPFDKIIVTCSPEKVPPALVAQLREGGRLIVPLGQRFQQSLYLFHKVNGELKEEKLDSTFFVPMTGQAEELRRNKGSKVPKVTNGSFEREVPGEEVPGWYYVVRARVVRDPNARSGRRVLQLENNTPGKRAHALQAMGLDGRRVHAITMSAQVRLKEVAGSGAETLPRVELTFYDERRAPIRVAVLGPWQGNVPWSRKNGRFLVPARTRLAVLVVGVFGATGEFSVDDVRVRATGAKRTP